MQNRCPQHLPDGFCVLLAYFISIFPAVLTSNEAFGAPQVKTNFNVYRYSQDDLGAVYSPQATTMKLWAPTAKTVTVALFDNATSPSYSAMPMECDKSGIWSTTINGNLNGKYYLYQVALPGLGADHPTIHAGEIRR
jgi:hypothetical protein